MILTMAVRSSNLPAAVKDIGDAAINTWYKVLSKILNTFNRGPVAMGFMGSAEPIKFERRVLKPINL